MLVRKKKGEAFPVPRKQVAIKNVRGVIPDKGKVAEDRKEDEMKERWRVV